MELWKSKFAYTNYTLLKSCTPSEMYLTSVGLSVYFTCILATKRKIYRHLKNIFFTTKDILEKTANNNKNKTEDAWQ